MGQARLSVLLVRGGVEAMTPLEWGTDYWGEILDEPTEAHARRVAEKGSAKLYCRMPGESWCEVVRGA